MKAAVFDTYVQKTEETLMHFDIVVPENTDFATVQQYGKAYLVGKGLGGLSLTSRECKFCHIEQASPALEAQIVERGYAIIEMENCND